MLKEPFGTTEHSSEQSKDLLEVYHYLHQKKKIDEMGHLHLWLGHCNKIVCFWSPPASILRAIPKNYYYSAHAQLCNCAMLEEHMSRTEDGDT